ncbi:glycoside hydrolase [Novosphingobium sp. 1949]|uniref:Glycoside hydrolase n=1 Tax=Novosphingobium organovorum TaxID=2930092 RepID=A0ABT0BGS2_9SPHN|nr:glycosyl hydrolase [Novosphingobium organovorum]MCJ2184232.1 glycoside hydrolase [Novosphingobium organovorum]
MASSGVTDDAVGKGRIPLEQLAAAFADPPRSARPRVWWHWMNGNITKDGIAKDLAWMKRVGIGGVQTFDVDRQTPTIVAKRLAYMTPPWREAFRFATERAERLGLEFTIASSPGWSETGGPWVPPADGMKKLVWSTMTLVGGHAFAGPLPDLPSVSGPFQDMPIDGHGGSGAAGAQARASGALGVYAYRLNEGAGDVSAAAQPVMRLADGAELDARALTDGRYATGVAVPRGTQDAPTIVDVTYQTPQTIRSATLFVPSAVDLYALPTLEPRLEVSEDGASWRTVARFALNTAPTTIGFAPITARAFRVVLAPAHSVPVYGADAAPGYDLGAMARLMAPAPTMDIRELRLSPDARIDQFEAKAGFAMARNYEAIEQAGPRDDTGVPVRDVVDLSGRVGADGTLRWAPPPGIWRVVRLGWSLTGKTNHPAPAEATGLEVDKLDAGAVRRYLEHYLDTYTGVVGPDRVGQRGINGLLTDSTEVGAFNWSPDLLGQFQRLRGYDPRPWLPTLTGVIVGSRAESDRFLDDYRLTIGQLHASVHYATLAQVAHEHGLKVYGESLEGWRTALGDDLDMRRYADVPMAAMWYYAPDAAPKPFYAADMRGAASVAHIYGQNLAAAESLTSTRQPWDQGPADLKRVVDWEFLNGINRIVIHSSVHQPVDDKLPGMSMDHIGQYFNRHETWAEMARPWIDYIARSSLLLQQGQFVADVAYFYGEEAPLGIQTQQGYFTDVPRRNGYDFVSAQIVEDTLRVDRGALVTPGGARYRLLYLSGRRSRMSVRMLRRLVELARAGATILGDPPSGPIGLDGDRTTYAALVHELWSGRPVTRIGMGQVIAGKDVDAALAAIGAGPDVRIEGGAQAAIPFVHRRLDGAEIYFLANRSGQPQQVKAWFAVSGMHPQVWRADTGLAQAVAGRAVDAGTALDLTFAPGEAYFVVFRKSASAAGPPEQAPASGSTPLAALEGPWSVTFQAGRGAPQAPVTFAALAPLEDNADPAIRYFSGVAHYTTRFRLPAGYRPGMPLGLDLGRVGVIAEVRVNGQAVGTAWHPPFRLDIGRAVRNGTNTLEVDVADLWVNRLIGDRQPGAVPVAWTVKPMYRADAPLRPAGLIGPVRLFGSDSVVKPRAQP